MSFPKAANAPILLFCEADHRTSAQHALGETTTRWRSFPRDGSTSPWPCARHTSRRPPPTSCTTQSMGPYSLSAAATRAAAHLLRVDAQHGAGQAQAHEHEVAARLQQLAHDAVRLRQVALQQQHAPARLAPALPRHCRCGTGSRASPMAIGTRHLAHQHAPARPLPPLKVTERGCLRHGGGGPAPLCCSSVTSSGPLCRLAAEAPACLSGRWALQVPRCLAACSCGRAPPCLQQRGYDIGTAEGGDVPGAPGAAARPWRGSAARAAHLALREGERAARHARAHHHEVPGLPGAPARQQAADRRRCQPEAEWREQAQVQRACLLPGTRAAVENTQLDKQAHSMQCALAPARRSGVLPARHFIVCICSNRAGRASDCASSARMPTPPTSRPTPHSVQ